MRINTNVASLNAYKNLQGVQGAISKSMEKLSSGLRINNAADDAAGLGISNKTRADIRALNQASRNAEQASSLSQIAEGGVSSIQKILERMKELATQSASDTVDGDISSGGRSRVQAEFTKIREELDRIVDSTQFQGKKLLDGSFGSAVTANTVTGSTGVASVSTNATAGTYTFAVTGSVVRVTNGAAGAGFKAEEIDTTGLTGAKTLDFDALGIKIEMSDVTQFASLDAKAITVAGGSATFMVGSTGQYGAAQADNIQLASMSLGSTALALGGLDLGSAANARTALSAIDSAIGTVNGTLGQIGAFQNRLSFAQENLKSAVNNLSAADSVVRDLDIAAEMTTFTKNNILSQAGTAMLAQANQLGQGVLQLLRA